MSLYDISSKFGGNPLLNASQPQMGSAPGRMPWSSGFEGMNGMSDEQRRKMLMMMMQSQQSAAQRFVPMGMLGGNRNQ
jgi:hypothetical protein